MKNLPTFEEFVNEEYLMNENDGVHTFGCAMMYFDNPRIKEITDKIEEDDVYIDDEDPSYGIEKDPHVTLLYGIHDEEVEPNEVFEKMDECELPKTLKLENVSMFKGDKYDVLKFDVNEELLNKINNKLCELPYSTDYPEYHAHSTIAYLKKGTGEKYCDMFKEEVCEVTPKHIVYSRPNGEKLKKVIE